MTQLDILNGEVEVTLGIFSTSLAGEPVILCLLVLLCCLLNRTGAGEVDGCGAGETGAGEAEDGVALDAGESG